MNDEGPEDPREMSELRSAADVLAEALRSTGHGDIDVDWLLSYLPEGWSLTTTPPDPDAQVAAFLRSNRARYALEWGICNCAGPFPNGWNHEPNCASDQTERGIKALQALLSNTESAPPEVAE